MRQKETSVLFFNLCWGTSGEGLVGNSASKVIWEKWQGWKEGKSYPRRSLGFESEKGEQQTLRPTTSTAGISNHTGVPKDGGVHSAADIL